LVGIEAKSDRDGATEDLRSGNLCEPRKWFGEKMKEIYIAKRSSSLSYVGGEGSNHVSRRR
jgi:hypothetical protein